MFPRQPLKLERVDGAAIFRRDLSIGIAMNDAKDNILLIDFDLMRPEDEEGVRRGSSV